MCIAFTIKKKSSEALTIYNNLMKVFLLSTFSQLPEGKSHLFMAVFPLLVETPASLYA